MAEINEQVAHPARVYDYMLGGNVNFAVDRQVAEGIIDAFPGGRDTYLADIRGNRAFLRWTVRHLANELGVRQFLDIGTGIPNDDNVHAVALGAASDSRIVYVDNDPVVLAHAHQLLDDTPERAASYIDGNLREPEAIIQTAADTLDLTQPVGVLLFAILHFDHHDDAYDLVSRLMEPMAPGSYLVISQLAKDIQPDEMEALRKSVPEEAGFDFLMRTRDEVAGFFDGLELVEPGVTAMDDWPHDLQRDPLPPPGWTTPYYIGLARKP
jgi:hypothetical protein